MKPNLSNRTFQWTLVLVFGLAVTTTVSSYFGRTGEPALSVLSEEPPAGESLSLEIPKPAEPKAAPALSSRTVEYHMAVSLKPEEKQLQGAQTFTWQNPGKKPVEELYLHLYPNAFASKKSTFMKESGGKLRNDKQQGDSRGWMELQTLTTEKGVSLMDRVAFVRPDDNNGSDETLAKVTLPAPVLPGEKVTLTMDFRVKLPQVFARMGYSGDFYMAGQWFPKLAKYETAGTRGRAEEGWNLHQYHGNSEFYSDFGIYDVKIKVPSDYTVAATGFPTKPAAVENEMKTYRFYADDVHDFAWAASPKFVYVEEPFSAPNVPGVKIKLYLDPAHEHLKARYLTAAKKALSRYSEWYGPYPYSTLSVVVPPAEGNGAGGMEYPTLITAWGAGEPKPGLDLERVVVHEIGHQYFYGMIASNEFEEAWLDEGFTSYAEDKVMEKEFGIAPNLPLEASYITSPEALKRNAWEYGSHDEYAENVYTRAKLVLFAIEKEIGPDAMSRVMKTYFQRWKFKHPASADFQAVLEETTKKSWKDFFDQYVYNGLMVDYEIAGIEVNRAQADGKTGYESKVLIKKRGATSSQVPIRFRFTDGTVLDKTWDGQGSEIVYTLSHGAPLEWAQIDPDYTLLLENKHINNFMKRQVDTKTNVRLNLGVSRVVEILFGWLTW
ncbi:M1 family metallopeptidase [Gorillibacterium sp. sgz5001074]|uniref:M1 family metallopeptidase n=1 Tax=Gorillibacterium sp. sgz5001074 TaxID=3446695 RepID=UPI003F6817FD